MDLGVDLQGVDLQGGDPPDRSPHCLSFDPRRRWPWIRASRGALPSRPPLLPGAPPSPCPGQGRIPVQYDKERCITVITEVHTGATEVQCIICTFRCYLRKQPEGHSGAPCLEGDHAVCNATLPQHMILSGDHHDRAGRAVLGNQSSGHTWGMPSREVQSRPRVSHTTSREPGERIALQAGLLPHPSG